MSETDDFDQPQSGPDRPGPDATVARFVASVAASRPTDMADQRQLPDRLCRAAATLLPVDGAAISVYLGADVAVPVGASDPTAAQAEALQFTLGEGPCLQAYTSRGPVLVPDLNHPDPAVSSRWPTYATQLTRLTSYQAAFAFPLLSNGVALGSLSLYRHTAGETGADAVIEAIAARCAGQLMDAELVPDPDGAPEHAWMDGLNAQRRKQVWVAQGRTMYVNRLTPAQALDLLRAQAFAAGRLVDDLAEDIAAGRLAVPVTESSR
jgi:hypothetical protein